MGSIDFRGVFDSLPSELKSSKKLKAELSVQSRSTVDIYVYSDKSDEYHTTINEAQIWELARIGWRAIIKTAHKKGFKVNVKTGLIDGQEWEDLFS